MVDRVLIVGAGPTGLTAALELSRLGIPVRIIDKKAAPPATSRAVSHNPNPVRVVLRHADGRLEQARAPWLISAEGAHSSVRATLDLPFEGNTRDEQYALGDLHVDGDLAETDLHIFSSAHGFLGLFPMGKRCFRLMASNPLSRPGKDAAPTLAELQAIYDQRSQIPARLRDMSWSSWFRITSRMVGRLKVGSPAARRGCGPHQQPGRRSGHEHGISASCRKADGRRS
jgi:2-polyprenyl-6-methoxyphenol hydroxylase-like FAD-dependent oxidoreductase